MIAARFSYNLSGRDKVFLVPFIGALFVFAISTSPAQASLGISPPFMNADHLVAGAVYSQKIYLVQDQPDEDLSITTNLAVPEKIRPWISIDKGFNFIIPKGTRQFPVVVTVAVPQGEPLGEYSGNLMFASNPGKTGQVTIAYGVNVAINLTIGTGIFESYQAYLTFLEVEEGWNPRVEVKFRNDGNIPESFDAASYELFDHFDAVRLAYLQKNSGFPETPPFSTNTYVVEFPTDFHLGVGEYWGIASFYKGDKLVATEKTVFQVVPAGTLSTPTGKMVTQYLQRNWQYVAGGIVVLVLGYLFYRKRKFSFAGLFKKSNGPG